MDSLAATQHEMSSILARLQSDLSSNNARDGQSEFDRARLNDGVASLRKELGEGKAERKENEARFRAALTEIETQFRAVAQMDNLRTVENRRALALLWEKVFGSRYPDRDFFPDMSQPKPSGS